MQCTEKITIYSKILHFILVVSVLLLASCGGNRSNSSKPAGDNESPEGLSTRQVNQHYPTRLAQGIDGNIYVSDAIAGSVLIYDTNLNLTGELKGLDLPLGVAVDSDGKIYVGNNGRDNIEVYSTSGKKINTIGSGAIKMPNDITLDQEENLYVADSLNNTVKVYDSAGKWLRNIGETGDGAGKLLFPVSVTVVYRQGTGELYVADQGHARVQVFNLQGGFLRLYGSAVEAFSSEWKSKFVRLQGLEVDGQDRLHAVDCFMNNVQILDADTGQYLDSYGIFGRNPGELNMPLDILITQRGQVLTANSGNNRVEVIYTIH